MAKKRGNGTGSLFKRTPQGAWLMRWRRHDGKWKETSSHTSDKAAAARILAKRTGDEALRRDGVIDARMDRMAVEDRRALADHVTDWTAALIAKGVTSEHADKSGYRVKRIITDCKMERMSDVTAAAVQSFLSECRKDLPGKDGEPSRPGLSPASSNHYLRAMKGFCRWLVREGRARDNPMAHAPLMNEKTDRRHERRALSAAELVRLIDTTRTAPAWRGIDGQDRAILYRTATETGLRLAELGSLTVGSFAVAGDPPTVTVAAAYSKRRREDVLPIRRELAAALSTYFAGKLPGATAFRTPLHGCDAVRMLRADLKLADIAYRDDAGRVADFHALRHTFITALARGGVHPKIAQALARHSTITLTMDRYSHTVLGELSDGLEALPNLGHVAQEAVASADGTHGPNNTHNNSDAKPCALGARRRDDGGPLSASRSARAPNVHAGICNTPRRAARLCSDQSGVAQLVEQGIHKPWVAGSSPAAASFVRDSI